MRKLIGIKSFIPASLLAVLLAFCFSAATCEAGVVVVLKGTVVVDRDGTVEVCVRDAEGGCEYLVPSSNLHGLLRSGQIAPGDPVDVKIVRHKKDRRQTHRGHVTVLK